MSEESDKTKLLDETASVTEKEEQPKKVAVTIKAAPIHTVVEIKQSGRQSNFRTRATQPPTVFVLQHFEEPEANPHTWISWLACLCCPTALPFGLAAFFCSLFAHYDHNKRSRRRKANWAENCSVAACVVGPVVFVVLVLLFVFYSPFNAYVKQSFGDSECTDTSLQLAMKSVTNSVTNIDVVEICGKLEQVLPICSSQQVESYVTRNWDQIMLLFVENSTSA